MPLTHGINIYENATSVVTPVTGSTALVVVGTSAINQGEIDTALEPKIAYNLDEAKKKAGYVKDFAKYSISEAINVCFEIFAIAPLIMINVLDPTKHKEALAAPLTLTPVNKKVVIEDKDVILSSLAIELSDLTVLVKDTDYTAAFNSDGNVEVILLDDGQYVSGDITAEYDRLKPSMVTEADILAGIELVKQVFPKFNMQPGLLIVPNWSNTTAVYNKMTAVSEKLNGLFNYSVVADLNVSAITGYDTAAAWKNTNGFTNKRSIVCYPKAKIGDVVYNLSTLIAARALKLDAENQGVPYVSPSNKDLKISGICDAAGKEIVLDLEQANMLNDNGIMTALNMMGFKSWGNYTAAYPGSTDVKDAFIPVRRMFDWWGNNFLLTYWQKVDSPMNTKLIESIVDTENIKAGGYVARFQLAGASIEFREDLNPVTNLLAGKVTFIQKLSPFVPAQVIDNILEYDASMLEASLI